jgi:hypothetical protein
MAGEKLEWILCAAVYVDTGRAEPPRRSYAYPDTGLVFTGWRHSDCFVTMEAWASRLWFWERWRLDQVQPHQLAGRNQGFLTSRGRFVDRVEAKVIAVDAGQLEGRHVYGKTELYSEDLY